MARWTAPGTSSSCADFPRRGVRRSKRSAAATSGTAGAGAEIDRALGSVKPPDVLFEKEWARGLFAAALARLQERCAREGKEQQFALLQEYELGGGRDRPSYADLARRFGIAVTDVTNRL